MQACKILYALSLRVVNCRNPNRHRGVFAIGSYAYSPLFAHCHVCARAHRRTLPNPGSVPLAAAWISRLRCQNEWLSGLRVGFGKIRSWAVPGGGGIASCPVSVMCFMVPLLKIPRQGPRCHAPPGRPDFTEPVQVLLLIGWRNLAGFGKLLLNRYPPPGKSRSRTSQNDLLVIAIRERFYPADKIIFPPVL